MTAPDETPRCATCKHWTPLDYPAESPHVYIGKTPDGKKNLYESPDVGQNELTWGQCDAPSGPGSEGTSRLMQVWDASSYAAALTTRDTFGCIEHTPR